MTAPAVLVVGACQAGVQLAASLREGGHDGRVVLVGAEPHLPYQRPPLSKAYLSGEATPESLALRAQSWYDAQGIELVLGERVLEVDLDSARARTDAGRELPCERLALTTGARVRRLTVPGADLPGVLYLRDDDNLYVLVDEPDPSQLPQVEEAVRRCPRQALKLEA